MFHEGVESILSSEFIKWIIGGTIGLLRVHRDHPLFHINFKPGVDSDRKSTRLNSSHVAISYAVFCLKKKTRLVSPNISGLVSDPGCYSSFATPAALVAWPD